MYQFLPDKDSHALILCAYNYKGGHIVVFAAFGDCFAIIVCHIYTVLL